MNCDEQLLTGLNSSVAPSILALFARMGGMYAAGTNAIPHDPHHQQI